MAKKHEKKKTSKVTGITIARDGTKFTATWKLRNTPLEKQTIQWGFQKRDKKGTWVWAAKESIGKGRTSDSYRIDIQAHPSFKAVGIRIWTKGKQKETSKKIITYTTSDAATHEFKVFAPKRPGLEMDATSTNGTKYTITPDMDASSHHWCTGVQVVTALSADTKATDGGNFSDSATVREFADQNSNGQYRQLKARAKGPGGVSSETSVLRHYLGYAPVGTWESAVVQKKSSYYNLTYVVNLSGKTERIDEIYPQYVITSPDNQMEPPDGGWTDGTAFEYGTAGKYTIYCNTGSLIGVDQCLWGRVKTVHDGVENFSEPRLLLTGELTAPEADITVTGITSAGFTVTISNFSRESTVPGSTEVYLIKRSAPEILTRIGTITASGSIQSTIDITGETGYTIALRNVNTVPAQMSYTKQDDIAWQMYSPYFYVATSMPTAPTITSVKQTDDDMVMVNFQHTWADAVGATISWTDDKRNWQSTEEPKEYDIDEEAQQWYITGLEQGKTYYIRVRSNAADGSDTMRSPWSEEAVITMSSAPTTPVLNLSSDFVPCKGSVMAYWDYVGSAGQQSAEIWEGAYNAAASIFTPTRKIAAVTTEQRAELKTYGWSSDTETSTYLALKVTSKAGESEFSVPVAFHIIPEPVVRISETSFNEKDNVVEHFDGGSATYVLTYTPFSNVSVTVDGETASGWTRDGNVITFDEAPEGDDVKISYVVKDEYLTLRTMPLTYRTGITQGSGKTTITITRKNDCTTENPDGSITYGAAGEAVYIGPSTGSIDIDDLIGKLDDEAWYTFTATVRNQYGMQGSDSIDFKVHWSHQAWIPTGTVVIDDNLALITPQRGTGYASGDTCDIYRLSKDKPELVVKGAAFNTQYVDPYPALGEASGYRLVTITKYGDFVTPDNIIAQYEPEFDPLDKKCLIIDYGKDTLELPYNITLSSQWQKDFKRTAMMGGTVVGDYNTYVLRDVTATSVLVRNISEDIVQKMHELAEYTDTVQVRTPDGSSFVADVQVQENRGYDTALVSYSLTIQRVDTEEPQGMTYAEWEAMESELE